MSLRMKFLTIPPVSATDELWTTKDGTQIPVSQMSEQHVRNALRMILRRKRELEGKANEPTSKGLLLALNMLLSLEEGEEEASGS